MSLLQTKSRSFEDPLNYPGKLTAHLAFVHSTVNSGSDSPPTDGSRKRLADLDVQLEEVFARLAEVLEKDVAAFNELVSRLELPAVLVKAPE